MRWRDSHLRRASDPVRGGPDAGSVWDADPRAVSSWLLTWQRIAVVLAIVSGLVMLALLVYAAWERLTR